MNCPLNANVKSNQILIDVHNFYKGIFENIQLIAFSSKFHFIIHKTLHYLTHIRDDSSTIFFYSPISLINHQVKFARKSKFLNHYPHFSSLDSLLCLPCTSSPEMYAFEMINSIKKLKMPKFYLIFFSFSPFTLLMLLMLASFWYFFVDLKLLVV